MPTRVIFAMWVGNELECKWRNLDNMNEIKLRKQKSFTKVKTNA
jgi:hypothetical protein